MATTTTNRICFIDLTATPGSNVAYQQLLLKESNKVTIRTPTSANFGSGTFADIIRFTTTLKSEGN